MTRTGQSTGGWAFHIHVKVTYQVGKKAVMHS